MRFTLLSRRLRALPAIVVVFLFIEFLDEFLYSAREAAWPVIRTDLGLDYVQIGLLLSLPPLLANIFFEPVLGILADIWRRRLIILVGGIVFAVAAVLHATSNTFLALMLASILSHPASGAFVALSQSTLMDYEPERREQNMARWTAAGSVGVSGGALAMGLFISLGIGWRGYFVLMGVLLFIATLLLWRQPFPATRASDGDEDEPAVSLRDGMRGAVAALKRGDVRRWLILLQFSDLMLDVLYGYLALYFVDVVGVDEAQAGLAVAVWAVVGLVGDFALIPLLERVKGLTYLRYSAVIEAVLYALFLIVPGLLPKLVLIGLIGFFNAGWYAILAAQLYASMPGQSGAVLTVSNISGVIGSIVPFLIGLAAAQFGLAPTMIFPLFACAALLLLLPREQIETAR